MNYLFDETFVEIVKFRFPDSKIEITEDCKIFVGGEELKLEAECEMYEQQAFEKFQFEKELKVFMQNIIIGLISNKVEKETK